MGRRKKNINKVHITFQYFHYILGYSNHPHAQQPRNDVLLSENNKFVLGQHVFPTSVVITVFPEVLK